MASVVPQLQEAAPRNKELLAILSETDHAGPALDQQKQYMTDLDNQIARMQRQITALDRKREREFKEHKKYRDSVVKRLAYKVGRKSEKFEEKAGKEEREYLDALREEHIAKEQEKTLRAMRDDGAKVASDLEQEIAKHQEAQRELDSLYDAIFQGPTPDFPDEDRKEYDADEALQTYHDTSMQYEAQGNAVSELTKAQKTMALALGSMSEARSYSQWDMWGGGTISDMMERNALHQAELQLREAMMLFQRAQQMDPMIGSLPPVNVAQGHIISDVLFDNIFTDMAFHDKIKRSQAEMQTCAQALTNKIDQARQRQARLGADMRSKGQALETARSELQKARQRIFESTTKTDTPNASGGTFDTPSG